MSDKIYVVIASWGACDEHGERLVSWCGTEDEAKDWVRRYEDAMVVEGREVTSALDPDVEYWDIIYSYEAVPRAGEL